MFEKCYIRRHIKLYTCYVVTKEMLYICDKGFALCLINVISEDISGTFLGAGLFAEWKGTILTISTRLSLTDIIIVQYRPTKRVTIHA